MNNTEQLQEITDDSLFDGNIICRQYRDGYRFSIDSVLLSHFPEIKDSEKILDLGTGCGILGLILLYRHKRKKISVTGLEKLKDNSKLTSENIKKNNFVKQFKIVCGDVRNIRKNIKPESYSLIISNPPFYASGTGRRSCHSAKEAARHQNETMIDHFIEGASYSVKNRCRIVIIYPAEKITELIQSFDKYNVEAKKIQFVYSYPESKNGAKLVLVEGVKNGGKGVKIMNPLYIYQYLKGPHTIEIEKMYLP